MANSVKIGDKVRFINAKGGGIVRKFQSKTVVLVEEEDGFETPVLISEVVVVKETDKYNFPIEEKKSTKEEEELPAINNTEKEEDYSSSPNDPMYANVPINITNTGPVTSISPIALNMNIDSIPNTIHIRA